MSWPPLPPLPPSPAPSAPSNLPPPSLCPSSHLFSFLLFSLPFLFFFFFSIPLKMGALSTLGLRGKSSTTAAAAAAPSSPRPRSPPSFLPTVSNSLEKSDAARAGRSPFGTEASVQRFASGATILRFADDTSDAFRSWPPSRSW